MTTITYTTDFFDQVFLDWNGDYLGVYAYSGDEPVVSTIELHPSAGVPQLPGEKLSGWSD